MSGTWRNCPECGDRRRIVDPNSPCIDCRLGLTALPEGDWVRRGHVLVFVAAELWDRNEDDATFAQRKPLKRAEFDCGTVRGYRKHLKLNEPTCANCRCANATDSAARKQEIKARKAAKKLARETKSTTRLAAELWLIEIQRAQKEAA